MAVAGRELVTWSGQCLRPARAGSRRTLLIRDGHVALVLSCGRPSWDTRRLGPFGDIADTSQPRTASPSSRLPHWTPRTSSLPSRPSSPVSRACRFALRSLVAEDAVPPLTSTPQTSTASCRPNPSNHPGTSSSPLGARPSLSHPRPTTAVPSRVPSAVHKRACARALVFGIGIILAWTSLPILNSYLHASFPFLIYLLSTLVARFRLPLPLLQSFRRHLPRKLSSANDIRPSNSLPRNEKPTRTSERAITRMRTGTGTITET